MITSTGYYPGLDTAEISRTVRVTLEPAPTFRYALFSEDLLEVKNNPVVTGDIYSQVGVVIGANTTVCGSVVVANGSVTMENNSRVAQNFASSGCSGKDGLVWVGGSIHGTNGVVIEGDAKASAPTGTSCNSTSTSYRDHRWIGVGGCHGLWPDHEQRHRHAARGCEHRGAARDPAARVHVRSRELPGPQLLPERSVV